MSCSIPSATDTCSGSHACDAQASASSSAPHGSSSKPPDSSSGITWKSFAHDRQNVVIPGSRAAPTSASPLPTTAACTRCSDSTASPRVTATSRLNACMTTGDGYRDGPAPNGPAAWP